MELEELFGEAPVRSVPLGHGTSGAGTVLTRHDLPDGCAVVTKEAVPSGGLLEEAYMLRYLAENSPLPVPAVYHAEDHLLVMDYLPGGEGVSGAAEQAAARAIAGLHDGAADAYGFEQDTNIATLHQPNPWTEDWWAFFSEHRLIHMAGLSVRAGRAGPDLIGKVERLCAKLPSLLDPPQKPGLCHGDLWGGNILVSGGRLSGFIDPAIYYGDPEMDLAMGASFGALGPGFFDHYRECRPLSVDFFEVRREIYNLWPLLVHVRLFGGGYLARVEDVLRRYAG